MRQALSEAQVKPTATPLVLLRAHGVAEALRRIQKLPPPEYPNAFRALLSLFSVADAHRRRTACRTGCTHDWHHLPPLR
ncbi:hypothetical protein KBK19_09530 [Microvirga sp. STR05]|uniref:Uncharacterized protein n=1 Tax=Hymenobacter duratus TaxID=2771356 RepID=A0ABR8JEJ9_9BACT|nr:hypothetical protein [Hymenobacter duratus]MBR7950182.1 hypothetical protein [Microvirga sp. STR05]